MFLTYSPGGVTVIFALVQRRTLQRGRGKRLFICLGTCYGFLHFLKMKSLLQKVLVAKEICHCK